MFEAGAGEKNVTQGGEWSIRPFREGDTAGIVALTNAADAVDRLNEGTSEDELVLLLKSPRSDPEHQVIVAEGEAPGVPDGVFLGYGRITYSDNELTGERQYELRVVAHPAVRALGLEVALGRRLIRIAAAGTAAGPTGNPADVRLCAYIHEGDTTAATWNALGMREVRRYWTMERSLSDPIEEPAAIPGITFRNYRRPEDNGLCLETFNASFADHYDYRPEPEVDWTYWVSTVEFRPDLSWLAVVDGGRGQIAGFLTTSVYEAENSRTERNEGWFEMLGTLREWRRRGVGRALLLLGLKSFKEAGRDVVVLGVDSQSLTGADRIYRSIGFRVRHSELQFEAQLNDVISQGQ